MAKFCLGDTHGSYLALKQVLKASGFDYAKDELICLGDVADGWGQVPECFNELLKMKNLVYVIGNHDFWTLKYLKYGDTPGIWLCQGGQATLDAYENLLENGEEEQLQAHLKLLNNALPYYEADNCLFVHGGYNWHIPIEENDHYDMIWDRHLFETAMYWQKMIDKGLDGDRIKDYDNVFIGHTPTFRAFPDLKPVRVSNVWNLDQGAAYTGRLTLMNIETKQYWQSDIVKELYPDAKGR